MDFKNWRDYDMEGLDFDDWPAWAQDQWYEHMALSRREKWEREHGCDEMDVDGNDGEGQVEADEGN